MPTEHNLVVDLAVFAERWQEQLDEVGCAIQAFAASVAMATLPSAEQWVAGIEIDAGERQAEFIRQPLERSMSASPSQLLVDHLIEVYCEARDWLEHARSLTGKGDTDEQGT